jgi:hypothetical protein
MDNNVGGSKGGASRQFVVHILAVAIVKRQLFQVARLYLSSLVSDWLAMTM